MSQSTSAHWRGHELVAPEGWGCKLVAPASRWAILSSSLPLPLLASAPEVGEFHVVWQLELQKLLGICYLALFFLVLINYSGLLSLGGENLAKQEKRKEL